MEKYFKEDETFNLRLIVIYTSDVQSAEPTLETDCFTLRTEQAFLSHIDGEAAFHEIQGKLQSGIPLADDDLMRLVILPQALRTILPPGGQRVHRHAQGHVSGVGGDGDRDDDGHQADQRHLL